MEVSLADRCTNVDFGSFDLSRVFGALQSMREGIAGMTHEDERRTAADRVGLGLVYGLRREDGRVVEALLITHAKNGLESGM